MHELAEAIVIWAEARSIHKPECIEKQTIKVFEEFGELCKAILKDDVPEIIDSIGDTLVTLIILNRQMGRDIINNTDEYLEGIAFRAKHNSMRGIIKTFTRCVSSDDIGIAQGRIIMLAHKLGYDPEHCLRIAWNEIKDRKGKTVDGVFHKD
jgi:NTP pyrophosphatase (non-canonical NTP hydrolase)